MQRDARAFLWDVSEAAQAVLSFTKGLDAAGYYDTALVDSFIELVAKLDERAAEAVRTGTDSERPA